MSLKKIVNILKIKMKDHMLKIIKFVVKKNVTEKSREVSVLIFAVVYALQKGLSF